MGPSGSSGAKPGCALGKQPSGRDPEESEEPTVPSSDNRFTQERAIQLYQGQAPKKASVRKGGAMEQRGRRGGRASLWILAQHQGDAPRKGRQPGPKQHTSGERRSPDGGTRDGRGRG